MKIVGITGGKGMLGSDVGVLAKKQGYDVRIFDLPEFDISNREDIEKIVSESDVIINCAAYTAVDKAESESDICRRVNADAVGMLGEIAKLADRYVIHISTDFVFGDKGDKPLTENAETNPLGVYGVTKLEGEQLLQHSGCRNSIIRIQWTYGQHGDHFVSKIAELAEKLDVLKVVDDQFGAPTPTTSVARALMCFVDNEIEGLYHFSAGGYASRYDVAEVILNKLNLNTSLTACSSDAFTAPAKRPLNSRFNCSKIDKVLDFERPEWRKTLEDFLVKRFH